MMHRLTLKIRRILFDDSGIAVAYTIVVFLVFFMTCISVYAMSENIRRKEELQNACDAAAYAGAVVEADILSRVAVLNRALSWTYVMTNRRQMDQTVHNWLNDTVNAFDEMVKETRDKADKASGDCKCWENDDGKTKSKHHIDVNGSSCNDGMGGDMLYWLVGVVKSGTAGIEKELSKADYYMNSKLCPNYVWLNHSQFVSIDTIKKEVDAFTVQNGNISIGYQNIDIINREIAYLTANIDRYVRNAVDYTAQAHEFGGDVSFVTLLNNIAGCFEAETVEDNFLAYDGKDVESAFKNGGNVWWVKAQEDESGIGRHYYQQTNSLVSKFCWVVCHHQDEDGKACNHDYDSGKWVETKGQEMSYSPACPKRLRSEFFGKQGTVVVGAQMSNVNPWAQLFGQSGIYSESLYFGRRLTAVSAARAGIRLRNSADGRYSVFYPGETRTDKNYTKGVWNLCEEDWDAVMLPINRAWCTAENNGTTYDNNGFATYGADESSYSSNAILAGVYNALNQTWTSDSKLDKVLWH